MAESRPAFQSDITRLAAEVGLALKQSGQTVATAESCTGGGIAEALTRIAGSSAWFELGWVTYSNRAKQQELNIPAAAFKPGGAVSEAVVQKMAAGARAAASAGWAVAVSGIAGPDGGSPDKPVGTVWFAWEGPEGANTECCRFAGDREEVRQQTIIHALSGLLLQMGVATR